jgi:eukaryotic-like serine/threonine-protein kinase
MLTPETVLQGRYRVIRQLGQGGMGAVYEAVDVRLDTTIALKETLFADERLRKQFEREARLLARMHHPALPRVSDHFSEGEGQFLVMQFIAGDDLSEMIAQRRGPFPTDQVLTWADQLLDALDYLHTQDPQIIHRDIKPQNLKLTARGQIILLDFGLAKGQTGEVSRVTTTASIFGYTPNYAPLEQIQGLGTDARSDIYALAATLYHLLTNVKPPDALTRAGAIVNSQPDPLKPANEVTPGVSPSVAAVLQRAMAQGRSERYASALEMRRALHGDDMAATVPIRSEAATVLRPLSAPTVSADTRMNAMQATVSADSGELTQPRSSGETTVVVHNSDKSRRALGGILAVAVILLLAGVGGFFAYQIRNRPAVVSQPLPSPSQTSETPLSVDQAGPSGDEATSTQVEEEKKNVEAERQQVATEEKAVKRQQTANKETTSRTQTETKPTVEGEDRDESEAPGDGYPVPEPPDVNNRPDVPQIGRPRIRQRPDGTIVREFPDGTRVLTAPDGNRILIRPDGTRQILRPARRLDRRRIPPPTP